MLDWLLENNLLAYLATAVTGALGSKLVLAKQIARLGSVLKEVSQLLGTLLSAIEPDTDGQVRLAPEEIAGIKRELQELLDSWKIKEE